MTSKTLLGCAITLLIPLFSISQNASRLFVPQETIYDTQSSQGGVGIDISDPLHPLHIFEETDGGTAVKIDLEEMQQSQQGGGTFITQPKNGITIQYQRYGLSPGTVFRVDAMGAVHSGYDNGSERINTSSSGLGVYRTSSNKVGINFNGSDPRVFWNSSSRNLSFVNGSNVPLRLSPDGKVGINTDNFIGDHDLFVNGSVYIYEDDTDSSPYSLLVEGTAIAEEMFIQLKDGTWGDFVFEKEYDLMPLDQLDDYLKENKHLPDFPSAAEIEKDGLPLGETERLLTIKVEELTLYILQLKAEIDQLKQQASE